MATTLLRVLSSERDGAAAVRSALLARVSATDPHAEATVAAIIADVRARGAPALLDLGRRFDCPCLECIEVDGDEWSRALCDVPEAVRTALDAAARNIDRFHR